MPDNYLDFVVRTDKKKFLLPLIMSSIPIGGITFAFFKNYKEEVKMFSESPIFFISIFSFLFFSFFYFIYKYFFDTKEKIIINNKGVWTTKHGLLNWESIWYFYFKEIKGKYIQRKILIKLMQDEKEIKLDITYLNKTEEEFVKVLQDYSKKYNIHFLDKEVQKVY